MKRIKRLFKVYFLLIGIGFNLFVLWTILDWPFYFDRPVLKMENPMPAEAIVCLSGGIDGNTLLPTIAGWDRIHTTVQLYNAGYAPKIIFTGGGNHQTSEAEVYTEVAQWLGCPEEAIVIEPHSNNTEEHTAFILDLDQLTIKQNSPLNIVTSDYHTRRAAMCFKKKGFTNFRMIAYYESYSEANNPETDFARLLKKPPFEPFQPNQKKSAYVFSRLKYNTNYILDVLREFVAIGWYWIKGYV
ncbi:YdcF family protein [Acidobacteriota bacterium]